MDAPIEVTFQLTPRDIYRANLAITLHSMGKLRYVRLVLFPLAMIACAGIVFAAVDANPRYGASIGLLWAVIFVPAFLGYMYFGAPYFRAKSTFKNSINMRSPIRYSFSDDQITQQTATARAELTWATYLKIRETPSFFLLFVQRVFAYPVPKRAFLDEAQIADFREMARRHIQDASFLT